MSHLLSMVKGLFEMGMLDPTPDIGDAGVLRRLVVQIQRSEFKFGNENFSGALRTHLYKALRTV
jgi:hypothetical protein